MSSADVQGTFLWHELTTTDPSAAGAFYMRVLGWKAQAWDKDPSYTVWLTAQGPIGGMMRLPADAQAKGATASWLSYVAVSDVQATVAAAQRLGGRVVKPAADLPDGGKYAVLADPHAGVFGVCTPSSTSTGGHATGEFAWHELATSDHSAAFRFYHELFGWEQLGVHDMGAMGPYVLFGRNGRQLGGIFSRPSSTTGSSPHWLVYVRVTSAAKAAEAAAAAGGRVVNAPHQVPGGSWIAQLTDPQGAAIAVNQPQHAVATATAVATPEHSPRPKPAVAAPAARKAPARKAAARKVATRSKGASRKAPTRKAATRSVAVRKAAARKAPSRRAAAAKNPRRVAAPRKQSSAKGRPAARRAVTRIRSKKVAAKRSVGRSARKTSARRRRR